MNTVPKLIETDDLNVAIIVQVGTTIYTRTSNNERSPFLSNKDYGSLSVDDVKRQIDSMKSYSDFVAYRVDDPNYVPPIPDGTILYDVLYAKGNVVHNGDIITAESWTPAVRYGNSDYFSSWKDILNNTVIDFNDVINFRYGEDSNKFIVKEDGTISGTFKGLRGFIQFKDINDVIKRVNSGEFSNR